MTDPADAIRITGLTKRFGDFEAVRGVDIRVPKGAFLVLVGPSGCGKSTMLRMLAGLEDPTDGEIAFNGTVVASRSVRRPPDKRDAGLVFQSYALWPHMTVAGNVDWPLKVARWDAARRRTRIAEVLDLLGIGDLAERYPNEISGGQQQRAAIARMIAPEPSILLFDEPLSNLDAKLRVEMRTELMRIHRATGATSVYVTHDQVEAMTMATHVAVMKDGLVQQFGAPRTLLDDPETAFVATFVGTPPGNLVPVTAVDGTFRYGPLRLAPTGGRNDHQPCQFLYRAEDLDLADTADEGCLPVSFAEAIPIAGRLMVTGMHDGLRLTAVTDRRLDARHGDEVIIRFPPQPSAIFDGAGRRVA